MIVTLLTDYGLADEFAGVCHGVIHGICPAARIIDITHEIEPHAVRQGAIVLRNALPYMPRGVHAAVVDPGVGTERRAVAVRSADGRLLVGPDNGVLSLAWQRCGGAVEAIDVTRSPHRLQPVSATFHGRDVFAPVAAHLAAGVPLPEAGEAVDPDGLHTLSLPTFRIEEGAIVAHALTVDRFGNVGLNVSGEELAATGVELSPRVEVEVGDERRQAVVGRTFADAGDGELLVYEDAYRALALAVNPGSAAAAFGLRPDSEIRISPR